MELNKTLCVNKNRKYKYIISLQLSPNRSNKHVICMMYMHLPFPLYKIISHMYETLSSFHLNLRVHLKLCEDISIWECRHFNKCKYFKCIELIIV